MKLIYVKIPRVMEVTKAYMVMDSNDLVNEFLKYQANFEKDVQETKWYQKPEKMPNGKDLKFHEMSEDWDERH